jgi:hypothetical protein
MARRGNLITVIIRHVYYTTLSLAMTNIFKPSLSGRVGRGIPYSGLLLGESGKTMVACGQEKGSGFA